MKSKSIIKDFQPDVAIGVGGFASGPLLFAATMMKVPSLIQEQNSYAGVTNKLLAKRVQRVCVAYENMERYFPKEKIVMTGNPIRQDIKDVQGKKDVGLKYFNLGKDKKIILIIGGSLGAGSINRSIATGLKKFADANVQLIWQTGKRYINEAKQAAQEFSEQNFYVADFINRMDFAFSCADVVISRAGASAISELQLVGKPSILVPSPNVAEDHQTKNAMALVKKDAALFVQDSEANEQLVDTAINLINDSEKQKKLSENISRMAIRNSAEMIVKEIYKLAGNS